MGEGEGGGVCHVLIQQCEQSTPLMHSSQPFLSPHPLALAFSLFLTLYLPYFLTLFHSLTYQAATEVGPSA